MEFNSIFLIFSIWFCSYSVNATKNSSRNNSTNKIIHWRNGPLIRISDSIQNVFFLNPDKKLILEKLKWTGLTSLTSAVGPNLPACEPADIMWKQINESQSILFVYSRNTSQFGNQFKGMENLITRPNFWNPYVFFIIAVEYQGELIQLSKRLTLNKKWTMNTHLYIIFEDETKIGHSLWEFYNIGDENVMRQINYGRPIDLVNITSGKLSRRQNFQGTIIRASAPGDADSYIHEAKFKDKGKTENETLEFESGMAVNIINFIAETFHFRIRAQNATSVFHDTANESTDIINQILMGLTDIAISEHFVGITRSRRVTHLQPTFSERTFAHFAKIPPNSARDIYTSSFNWQTWLSLLGTWFLVIIFLKIFILLKNWGSDDICELNPKDLEIANQSFLWGIGATCQQGWSIRPESTSIRIIFMFGYLMSLICYIAFSATIVSTLSVRREVIKNFNDLVQHSFRYIGAYFNSDFEYMKALLFGIGINISEHDIIRTSDEHALHLMTSTKCAYFAAPDTFAMTAYNLHLSDSDICGKFSSVKVGMNYERYAMMVQKDSPLTEFFNWQILKMVEMGLIRRYMAEYVGATYVRCYFLDTQKAPALELYDLFTAYLVLVSGYLASLTVMVLEMFHSSIMTATGHWMKNRKLVFTW